MRQLSASPITIKTHPVDLAILNLFRKRNGEIVSGEELSGALNISRTAIWKHVKSLQQLGFIIDAVPSQGYRLLSSPDILLPSEIQDGLDTVIIGKQVICYPEAGSTNSIAYKLAEEGAVDGTCIIADSQTSGKGRLGRSWVSPPGVNLYCSVILRPPVLPHNAFHMTFLSAVAVARAIEGTVSLSPTIKWPNDVLINGRKTAGLLNEMSAETEKIHFIILGIGVNVNMLPEQFPSDLRHPATSLFIESGEKASRVSFVRNLLVALDSLYAGYLRSGYAPIADEWLSRSRMQNRMVSIKGPRGEILGAVRGIDQNGALIVALPDGRTETVLSGDVTFTDNVEPEGVLAAGY